MDVAAEFSAVALEHFNLAVNGEHLLNEGAAEMEKAHRESAFVVGSEAHSGSFEKQTEVRTQEDRFRWLATARAAGFQKHTVRYLPWTYIDLGIAEAHLAGLIRLSR